MVMYNSTKLQKTVLKANACHQERLMSSTEAVKGQANKLQYHINERVIVVSFYLSFILSDVHGCFACICTCEPHSAVPAEA